MLYLLYGKDTDTVREKTQDLVATLLKKRPDAQVFSMNDENFNEATLREYLGSQGLFSHKYIIVLSNLLGNKETRDAILSNLKDFHESQHICIVREGSLEKAVVTKIEKHAEKVQECVSDEVVAKKEANNLFALCDAFGARDKKSLWVLYQKAKMDGVEDEQIHGILWWQVKAMLVSVKVSSATQSGLSPFVFKKSQAYASHFSAAELREIGRQCIEIYHNARRGGATLDVALERFLLSV